MIGSAFLSKLGRQSAVLPHAEDGWETFQKGAKKALPLQNVSKRDVPLISVCAKNPQNFNSVATMKLANYVVLSRKEGRKLLDRALANVLSSFQLRYGKPCLLLLRNRVNFWHNENSRSLRAS